MNERIVALDVGDRRIGIAVSDALGITAQPIETGHARGVRAGRSRICQIAQRYENQPHSLLRPAAQHGWFTGDFRQKKSQLAEKTGRSGLSFRITTSG